MFRKAIELKHKSTRFGNDGSLLGIWSWIFIPMQEIVVGKRVIATPPMEQPITNDDGLADKPLLLLATELVRREQASDVSDVGLKEGDTFGRGFGVVCLDRLGYGSVKDVVETLRRSQRDLSAYTSGTSLCVLFLRQTHHDMGSGSRINDRSAPATERVRACLGERVQLIMTKAVSLVVCKSRLEQ